MKGRPLPAGGTIGAVAPSSPWDERSQVERGIRWWESKGYRVKLAENVWAQDDYVAGDPKGRARDLEAMFADPEVDVVQVIGGGYGCSEVVPHLDLDVVAANPKPFVGYSDITVLHAAFRKHAGLVSFYGPGLMGVGSPERGDWVNVEQLSYGTLDQFYLAARLGLVRQVTQDRRPPLIFDDPFVTFDDQRAKRALELLKRMAADHQVIYLTCSSRYDRVAAPGGPAPHDGPGSAGGSAARRSTRSAACRPPTPAGRSPSAGAAPPPWRPPATRAPPRRPRPSPGCCAWRTSATASPTGAWPCCCRPRAASAAPSGARWSASAMPTGNGWLR